jgi:hypothetical protein
MNEIVYGTYGERTDPTGPVSCAVCGCRLTEAQGLEGVAWRHFQLLPDTDARGCRPRCLEDFHRRDGTVLRVRDLSLHLDEESAPAH